MDRDGIARLIVGQEGARTTLAGLEVEALPIGQQEGQFDLTFHLLEMGEAVSGVLVYNTDLYDAATVDRLGSTYRTLLEGMVEDPTRRLEEIPLLPSVVQHQLLVEWNATEQPAALDDLAEVGLAERFAAQVARDPEAPAVVDAAGRLSYGELDRRAEALAARLRTLPAFAPGEAVERRVAVCLPRSADLIVAVLAVIKAGAAYIPMDEVYPEDRLRAVLDGSGAVALLTHRALVSRFGKELEVEVLALDEAVEGAPAAPPPVEASSYHPAAAAYVIFTSGSTGEPKGVVVSQGALLNLLLWHQRHYGLSSEDRVTQFAGPAFDASVWEIWPALLAGATIHIPNAAARASADAVAAWF
jgi:non-ribosomal peptide synthetase component F